MASPPPSSSSKFRAEPFVNMTSSTLDSARSSVSSNSTGGAHARPLGAAVSLVPDAHRRPNRRASTTVLDESTRVPDEPPSPFTTGRLSTSSASGTSHAFSVFQAHTPSFTGRGSVGTISDVQRSSITSTVSSSSRRSSYEGGGGLEKIHTGQGKSKRKPISVQQWGMMNTFKIRPPTALEASGSGPLFPPTPPSVAPHQQYIPYVPEKLYWSPRSDSADRRARPTNPLCLGTLYRSSAAFVLTDNPASNVSRVPQPAAILHSGPKTHSETSKEAPLDPIAPSFHHEELPRGDPTEMEGVQVIQSPQTAPVLPTLPSPTTQAPLAPEQPIEASTKSPVIATLPPPPSTTPSAGPSMGLTTQAPPAVSYSTITSSFSYQPTKYDLNERIFTLPDTDPLDRGGQPPKKWNIIHHKSRTLAGGEIALKRWVSQGELATPATRPVGFKPVPLVHLLPMAQGGSMAVVPSGGTTTSTPLANPFVTSGSSLTAQPFLPPAPPVIPASTGVKRVKKVKSEADLGGSEASGVTTPKRKAPGTGVKRTKKVTPAKSKSLFPKKPGQPNLISLSREPSEEGDAEMLDP
ncbi:SubName: Full=Uncharacterized protein {ECO:0000313/EMBL:CCA68931.1} [Serendipita indica DSM 11827]|nr:SubName: Full=Uncharacterized protein {ECO:0000313/EMBL:CCA68931.1} [Serendipita indica DSM 11827]